MTKVKVGLIYKITNKANNKSYIGQTTKFNSKANKCGLEARWEKHVYNATTNKNKCVILENAIRKYGADNFEKEILLYCNMNQRDEYEIRFIDAYNSCNKKYGYNITKGGNGINGVVYNDDYRDNMSRGHNSATGYTNIKPIKSRTDPNIIIGYKVARMIDRVNYTKDFGSTKNTPEKNLELAIQWRDELKIGEHREYERENGLPKNISYELNKAKEIVGYRVRIGKKTYGTFSKQSLSMEEKLKLAIKRRDDVINEKQ